MRIFFIPGTSLKELRGVELWIRWPDGWERNSTTWVWSTSEHPHYEVQKVRANEGSYWVPTSTDRNAWGEGESTLLQDLNGRQILSRDGRNMWRPNSVYIWIPEAIFARGGYDMRIENNPQVVACNSPQRYPPSQQDLTTAAPTPLALLDEVLAPSDQTPFQDSDGLISFVNLSSSFVTDSAEFKTGRLVCDKVSNFFATIRQNVFSYLLKNPSRVLAGDTAPTTQWDPAVTHYIQWLLTQAGGLTNYHVTTEVYSNTQVITEFSTDFIKLMFDVATVPTEIMSSVVSFLQGVGQSLRASWDDRSRNYQTALLGQCHEAVPVDETGEAYIYFPKIKYYYISVDSSQQAFTSDCATVRKITFNFRYESYVTALAASVLDNTSSAYKSFVGYLDKAQAISYENASNTLDNILDGASSTPPTSELGLSVFGVDLQEYPVIPVKSLAGAQNGASMNGEMKAIEEVLNTRVV